MFETGQILVGVGVGVIGLLRLVRVFATEHVKGRAGGMLYHLLTAIAMTHVAVGLILALNTYRSWAHEDDIIAIISVTFMLLWVSWPALNGGYNAVGNDKCEIVLSAIVHFLRLACCIGACVMMGFIGARGKADGDRTLVWCGIALVSAFGPVTQYIYNMLALVDDWKGRVVYGIFEMTGWALFAMGALRHELDLETPVGFPIRP